MDADTQYLPTKEKNNFVRLIVLLTDICTDVFRDVFNKRVPPANLASILSYKKSALISLKILNHEQRQLLYPHPSGTPFKGSSRDMDLSLLYTLLRSICCIPDHINGWGKPPTNGDDSLAANIEWIRIQRNVIQGHVKKGHFSDSEFEKHWKIIYDAIKSIEINFLGGGTKYQHSMDMMYSTDFNPEMEKFYLDEIKKSHDREIQNRELIEEVNNQLISTNMHVVSIESRLSGVQVDVNKMRHEQGSLKRTGKSLIGAQRKTERQLKYASQSFTEMKNHLSNEQQSIFENTQKTVVAAMSDIKREIEEKTKELAKMEKLLVKVTSDDEEFNHSVRDDLGEIKKNISELKVGICSMEKQYYDISVQLQQIQGDKEPSENKELQRIIDYSVEVIKQYDEQKDIVQTGAMRFMMQRLTDVSQQCAFITGFVGQGKSTLAKEGVSQLSKHTMTSVRQPVIITRPDQWSIIARSKTPMIVFIDDIFGKTNFDLSTMTIWSPLFNDMQIAISSGKVILIMTMRKHIFDDAKLHLLEYNLFQEKYVIDLTSEDLQLTNLERKNILIAHIQTPESKAVLSDEANIDEDDASEKVPISMSSIEKIVEKSTKLSQDLGYPQCCRMFVTNKSYLKQGVLFFENPVEFLKLYLDKLYSIDKMAYFTLCYTLFSDNQLYLEDLHVTPDKTQNNTRFHDIALICCIPQSSIWDLLIAIPEKVKAMNGSFFKLNKLEGYYELSHRSVSDALCWSFGKLSSRKLVEHCPLTFLCENVRTRYCPRGSEEVTLEIVPRYYYDLARRITNEILLGNFFQVANHVILQDGDFVEVLVEFWKEMGNFSKILEQKNSFRSDDSFFTLIAMIPGGELLKQIIQSGELEKLEDETSDKLKADALKQVCSVNGDFEVYSVLVALSARASSACLVNAASSDSLEIVVDLLNRYQWWSVDISKARITAMLKGNLRSYKVLVNHDTSSLCLEDLMTAVEEGLEDFVSHLLQRKTWSPLNLSHALEKACETGHFKIFNLLLQSDSPVSANCLWYAAEHRDNKIFSSLLKSKQWPDKEKGIAFARAICKKESDIEDNGQLFIEALLQESSLSENALGEAFLQMVRLQNITQTDAFIDKFPSVIKYVDSRLESPLHHVMDTIVSLDVVDLLLKRGVDIHLGNLVQRTALHFAASFGQTDVAEMLISHGADVNVKDENLETPLHCAAKVGKKEVAKLLLLNGADVNAENFWHLTPLCQLRYDSFNLDFAVLLGSKGAKINGYNFSNFSAEILLLHCLKIGNLEFLKEFLEKGEIQQQDVNKALLQSCQEDHGNFEIYKCLLDFKGVPSAGCLMESVFNEYDAISMDLLDRKSDWSEKELSKALQFACKNGNKQIYEKLLESGAVVEIGCMLQVRGHMDILSDILSRQTWSDYQLGVVMADGEFQDENIDNFFENIIKSSSSVSSVIGECLCESVRNSNLSTADRMVVKYNANINFVNGAKSTPLHIAAESGENEMVKYLLGKGADTQAKDGCGKTPFLVACGTSYLSNVEILYKNSVKVKTMVDNFGRNGLHYAAKSGSIEVLHFLWMNGFSCCFKDFSEQTPLHLAADTGNVNIFYTESIEGIDMNMADRQGQTPLHHAVTGDHTDFVIRLLSFGACIDKMDSNGKSPFHLGSNRIQQKIVEWILERVKACHTDSINDLIFLAENGFVNSIRSAIATKHNVATLDESMYNSFETIPVRYNTNKSMVESMSLSFTSIENSYSESFTVNAGEEEMNHLMAESYSTKSDICGMSQSVNINSSRKTSSHSLQNSAECLCKVNQEYKSEKPLGHSMINSSKTIPNQCTCIINQSLSMAESRNEIYQSLINSEGSLSPASKSEVSDTELSQTMSDSYKSLLNDCSKRLNVLENKSESVVSLISNVENSQQSFQKVYINNNVEESMVSSFETFPCDKKTANMEESQDGFCSSFLNDSNCLCTTIPEDNKDNDLEHSMTDSFEILHGENCCLEIRNQNAKETPGSQCNSSLFYQFNQDVQNISADENDKGVSLNCQSQIKINSDTQENVKTNSLLSLDPIHDYQSRTEHAMKNLTSLEKIKFEENTTMKQFCMLTGLESSQVANDEINRGLLYACKSGNYDFYDIMLDLGAKIFDGCLLFAIQSKCTDLVNDLLIQRQNWKEIDLEAAKEFIIQSGNLTWFKNLFFTDIKLDFDCLLLTLDNVEMLKLMLTKTWNNDQLILAFVQSCPPDSSPLSGYTLLLDEIIQKGLLNECLYVAVGHGNEHIVKNLITLNVDLESRHEDGQTPVHYALRYAQTEILDILIQNGASLEARCNDIPILDWTLTNCSLQMFEYLAQKLTCRQFRKKEIDSTLLAAVKSKNHKAVKILIEAGGSLDFCDDKGRMLIHYAALAEDIVTINCLLGKGAFIDDRDYEDCTPLHLVAQQGLTDIISPLVDSGAFVDDKNGSGRTPLHLAVDKNKMSTVVKLLDLNAGVNCTDNDGKNVLHIAVINNNVQITKLLLEHKADVNHKDWNQRIPLHYAVLGGNPKLVKLCVKHGFNRAADSVDQENINCPDDQKWTPLHHAVENGEIEIMKILLKYGASVDIKDRKWKRPLHIATKHRDVSLVELLCNHGAIIDVRDENNDTPLHQAVKENNINCVSYLLQKGANAMVGNKMGITPLDLAKNNSSDLFDIFRKHFGDKDSFQENGGKNECSIM